MSDKSVPIASFETNLQALETLVSKLERNELSLQEALAAYAEGTALVKACQGQLVQAEVTLTEISAALTPPTEA
ncbi:MAG: exodeoxyribonuclease VII small subunit [Pseudomonadota bacterium]|jgi:exodeoxyribonuclease VII small subunit